MLFLTKLSIKNPVFIYTPRAGQQILPPVNSSATFPIRYTISSFYARAPKLSNRFNLRITPVSVIISQKKILRGMVSSTKNG